VGLLNLKILPSKSLVASQGASEERIRQSRSVYSPDPPARALDLGEPPRTTVRCLNPIDCTFKGSIGQLSSRTYRICDGRLIGIWSYVAFFCRTRVINVLVLIRNYRGAQNRRLVRHELCGLALYS
jgi:hypothetical protein